MVTLTYSFSEDEFLQAARVLWSYEGIGDRGNWVFCTLCTTAGVALLTYGFWTGWIWLGAAGFLASITLLRNVIWRRSYLGMAKYSAPITASFSADTVETQSVEGHAKLPWATFSKYAETPDYFFLKIGRRGLSIIPKSAIQTEHDLEELREHITANLPRLKMRWT